MNRITNTTQGGMIALEQLAEEARFCVRSMERNIVQLGRVLSEAKTMVPHGEWAGWIKANAGGISQRTADNFIAIARRFGGRSEFDGILPSALSKLLALPEGTEEAFMQDHDVKAMTSREVAAAVKQAREEARAEAQGTINALEEECAEANARLAEMEKQVSGVSEAQLDELLDDMREQGREEGRKESRAEADHFAEMARQAVNDKAAIERDRKRLQAELEEQNDMLREQQEAMNQAQAELLNLKSAQARGDAERAPSDELTLDVFSRAVREFMGLVARMPYMQTTFGGMTQGEKNQYAELLRTVEGWTAGARQALESVTVEGGIIVG